MELGLELSLFVRPPLFGLSLPTTHSSKLSIVAAVEKPRVADRSPSTNPASDDEQTSTRVALVELS